MSYSILIAHTVHLGKINSVLVVLLLANSVAETSNFKDFTIFSILKSMPNIDPIENQIQTNAIWSWSQLVPMENILLFFDEQKSCFFVRTLYQNISCRSFRLSKCFHSSFNRSFINCAFDLAQQHRRTSILVFVNGDIFLHESISHSISFANDRLSEFFLVGCRRDYEMSRSVNHSDLKNNFQDVLNSSRLHPTTGIDFFAFKIDTPINMAPFLVGVYRWDNWLLSEILLRTNITVIDGTRSIFAIHQQPKHLDGEKPIHHSDQIGALYNDILAKNISGVDYKVGFIHNAHKILSGNCEKKQCEFKDNLNRSEIILLMQRANVQNYIAVLTVTSGYMPLVWNWICWARRIKFHNYILLAEDYESYKVLRAADQPVFISYQQSLTMPSKSDAKYGSYESQITMTYRLKFLMRVLRAGFHFLSANVDSIWLANPFDYVSHNLSITVQGQPHEQTKMSGGFIVVHATPHGRKFWQDVINCQHQTLVQLREQQHIKQKRLVSYFTEQICINDRLKSTEVYHLDPYLFPDGHSFFDQKQSQSRGIVPAVIHGNWLVGLESTIKRLQSWNLLAATENSCDSSESGIPHNISNKVTRIRVRIRVLTYNNVNSLQRLLKSLNAANYLNDSVALDISVDQPSPEASVTEKNQWRQIIEYLGNDGKHPSEFQWSHGSLSIVVHKKHVGLLGQRTVSTDHQDIQLFLEEDAVVSPHFYIFLKQAINFYYINQSNYDSRMFGLSMQHQHIVLGQRTGFRIRSIDAELNETGASTFFKYQLLGTWDTVFFPEHWHAFLKWIRTIRLDDMQAGCTPSGLLSTEWWTQRHQTGKMWTSWFIRFAFDRGWYSLYTNFPNQKAFIIGYHEGGLNFNTTRAPMNPLIEHLQPHIHFNFTKSPPIFDYHFTRIDQPALLAFRRNLWHQNHFVNQCYIVKKNDNFASKTENNVNGSLHNQKTKMLVHITQTESRTLYIRNVQARLLDESLSTSADYFHWFLIFEVLFVFPIAVVAIPWSRLINRRKRSLRRTHFRK